MQELLRPEVPKFGREKDDTSHKLRGLEDGCVLKHG
jgi:hypothetical protein